MSDWERQIPKFRVQRIESGTNVDSLTVVLARTSYAKKPAQVRVEIDRGDVRDPRLEIGAVWTLTPGVREPTYREQLAAARAKLEACGGDREQLTADEPALINDADMPY
jgi:hypothetical protein